MNAFLTRLGRSAELRDESAKSEPDSTAKLLWPRAAAALAGVAFALSFAGFASAGSDQHQPLAHTTVVQEAPR